jgi:class 3 adenylate cyclase/tetratricopeptide (TPR) repeat protein
MPDVASWLARHGLDKYIEAFTANEVDFDSLRHLSEDDLKELGLPIGPRRKVLAAIAELDDGAKSTSRSAVAPASAPYRREAERRQLTVMFVDLVGSTELSQRLDLEEMRGIIRAYQNTVSAEITRYEGRVAKLMGDGVLAYFGWPQAHEDDAERAARAGLAATAATATLVTPQGNPLAARVGIATGLVVVGDLIGEGSAQEEAVVGETPNLAARLQALAEPNTVVIADGTQRLIAGLFDMVDLGHRDLRGFATPVRAWRIAGEAGEAGAEGRFDALHGVATPLVGRTEELELLLQRWQQARVSKGQVVLLSGEPGIGKSRLIAALQERLGTEPHARLRYFCSPYYVNSALHPIIKQLERAAGLRRDDDTSTKLDKLEVLLRRAVSDITEPAPLLAELLSIDAADRYAPVNLVAQARKARTLGVLTQLLKGLAARQPLIVLVEDAHWIDPTTSEWLDMVIDALQDLSALLIISFRPEFQPRWTLSSHVTALSLTRLGRDEGAAIADRVAGGKALPSEVKNQILAKTEGVPLFVEELTKTVMESGLLIDAGDHYALSGPLPLFAIPSTLQDSLMARLDRLDVVKEVAQTGACIGRVFHHRLLAAVTGSDSAQLEGALQKLEKSELVFRRGTPPEASYTFKHALVQDTAYQSLLKSRRQHIHANIASTLESQFPEVAEAEPEILAHHFTAAGLTERAVAYWLKAGQQAQKRSANLEAVAHLGKGLELVASLPDSENLLRQEIHLQTAMGVTMMAARGWGAPAVLQACTRARVLCEKLGDKDQLFVALCGEASYHMISGNLRAADELGRRCLELALASGDHSLLLEAHHRQWATKFFMGDYAAADRHADHGIATYDPDRDHSLTYIFTGHDPGVCCRNFSARILWLRGYSDQAIDRCREAIALAERVSHPLTRVMAQQNLSYLHLLRREPDEGRRCLDKWIALSNEFGLQLATSEGRFQFGWALAEEGHTAEGIAEMREGLAAITATGAAVDLNNLCVLARACGEHEISEGLILLERALVIAESGAKYQLPELLRTKGELLLRLNPRDDTAEDWFQQAVAMARDDGTKSLELRAALSLARLYWAQDRYEEARDVLSPVYAWFTEGFDTRDLVDAKELLDRLR